MASTAAVLCAAAVAAVNWSASKCGLLRDQVPPKGRARFQARFRRPAKTRLLTRSTISRSIWLAGAQILPPACRGHRPALTGGFRVSGLGFSSNHGASVYLPLSPVNTNCEAASSYRRRATLAARGKGRLLPSRGKSLILPASGNNSLNLELPGRGKFNVNPSE
jgi:hypothetical protein